MTFEEALQALKDGKAVKRKEWLVEKYVTLKDNKIVDNNLQSYYIDTKDLTEDCWEECEAFILNRKEREYLSSIIKPFEDRVCSICKTKYNNCSQRICIEVKKYYWDDDWYDDEEYEEGEEYEYIELTIFEKDTMYANMEADRNYTLEELGL